VNTAVSQMDKVTQQNASAAEESASASEELAAQAQAVKGMVNELVSLVGGAGSVGVSGRQARGKQRVGASAKSGATEPHYAAAHADTRRLHPAHHGKTTAGSVAAGGGSHEPFHHQDAEHAETF